MGGKKKEYFNPAISQGIMILNDLCVNLQRQFCPSEKGGILKVAKYLELALELLIFFGSRAIDFRGLVHRFINFSLSSIIFYLNSLKKRIKKIPILIILRGSKEDTLTVEQNEVTSNSQGQDRQQVQISALCSNFMVLNFLSVECKPWIMEIQYLRCNFAWVSSCDNRGVARCKGGLMQFHSGVVSQMYIIIVIHIYVPKSWSYSGYSTLSFLMLPTTCDNQDRVSKSFDEYRGFWSRKVVFPAQPVLGAVKKWVVV